MFVIFKQKGALNILLDDLVQVDMTVSANMQDQQYSHTTSIRQIYISAWSLLCFLGMIVVVGMFIVRGISISPASVESSIGTPLLLSSSSMGKLTYCSTSGLQNMQEKNQLSYGSNGKTSNKKTVAKPGAQGKQYVEPQKPEEVPALQSRQPVDPLFELNFPGWH